MGGLDERVADSLGQELTVGASELCRRGALGCFSFKTLFSPLLTSRAFKNYRISSILRHNFKIVLKTRFLRFQKLGCVS